MNLWGHSYPTPGPLLPNAAQCPRWCSFFFLVMHFIFPHSSLPLQNILAPPMSSLKVFFCPANQSFQPIWPSLAAPISAKANVTLILEPWVTPTCSTRFLPPNIISFWETAVGSETQWLVNTDLFGTTSVRQVPDPEIILLFWDSRISLSPPSMVFTILK